MTASELRTGRDGERGFTLLEAVITVLILAVVAFLAMQAVLASARLGAEVTVEHELLIGEQRGFALLADDVRNTSATTDDSALAITGGGRGVTFRRNLGFDPATNRATWSGPISYAWQLVPGETANGVDDDKDGLVDEGRIVRTDPSGQTAVIANNVDNASFALATNGQHSSLTVRFDVLRVVSEPKVGLVVRRRPVSSVTRLPD